MKKIYEILIKPEQLFLISNEKNIQFNFIQIRNLGIEIFRKENDYFLMHESNKKDLIKIENFELEHILLKLNKTSVYYNLILYLKNIEKKYNISDNLINIAISSIENDDFFALKYAWSKRKRLKPEVEERIINNSMQKLNELSTIRQFNIDVLHYINYVVKERVLLFEKFLLEFINKNGGLKITGIPDTQPDRVSLYEIIYKYTIINRNEEWNEIGISDRKDLLKLRKQINERKGNQLSLIGYGELDYFAYSEIRRRR